MSLPPALPPHLTPYQKAQLFHIQALYQSSRGDEPDESKHHDAPEILINPPAETSRPLQQPLRTSADSTPTATHTDGDHGGGSSENQESEERDSRRPKTQQETHHMRLLQQLDLALELRTKLESACQNLQQSKTPQHARTVLLKPDMKDAQLKLVALSEAVKGGYTLDHYDYYSSRDNAGTRSHKSKTTNKPVAAATAKDTEESEAHCNDGHKTTIRHTRKRNMSSSKPAPQEAAVVRPPETFKRRKSPPVAPQPSTPQSKALASPQAQTTPSPAASPAPPPSPWRYVASISGRTALPQPQDTKEPPKSPSPRDSKLPARPKAPNNESSIPKDDEKQDK